MTLPPHLGTEAQELALELNPFKAYHDPLLTPPIEHVLQRSSHSAFQ